jgi:hypothetical protein
MSCFTRLRVRAEGFATLRALAGGCALAGTLALGGCASNPAEHDAANREREDKDDDAYEAASLQRKLDVAQRELAALSARQEAALAAARTELDLAEGKLETFREFERPSRLGETRLDLRTTKDRAQEAADELAQIEAMYEEQDLDDLTKEFVVARGRRQAERAAERVSLEEQDLTRLTERTLPAEELELRLAVDRAVAAVADAKSTQEIEQLSKQHEIEDLRHELAELQKKSAARP